MTFEDPNPYARNLIIISLMFIFYNWLELSPPDQTTFNILFNKFEIGNTKPLKIIPWIFLAWFLFRFWQESSKKLLFAYTAQFQRMDISDKRKQKFKRLAEKNFKEKDSTQLFEEFGQPHDDDPISLNVHHLIITKECPFKLMYVASFEKRVRRGSSGKHFYINVPYRYFLFPIAKKSFEWFVRDKNAAKELIPYLLAFLAILSGLDIVFCS
ncbi:hypothetical protein [Saccharospirillum salsuginis]|uniref:Uncharacterized protein n=1 Tax=Saccharospirillum salsuginis TaxID=418750 RepID=A0A918K7R5_9GAMM|nr:hypothetical protein [Saccharospirillum salsuginis]GGX51435.1 hypothetical protein GCM10007392_18400 [Saccharospirillum salsuginis]